VSIYIYIPPKRRTTDAKPFTKEELEDLANRMAAALEEFMGWGSTQDEFKEDEHPRAPDGKFGSGSGTSGSSETTSQKPTSIKAKSAKAGLHELLSTGHPFSKSELISILGVSEKRFSDYMAMVKNPKYAGKEGALTIERNEKGEYFVKRQEGKEAPKAPPAAPPSPTPPKAPEPPAQAPPAPPPPAAKPEAGAYAKMMADKDNPKRFHKAPVRELAKAMDEHYGVTLVHADDLTAKKKLLSSLEAEYIELFRLRGKTETPIANAEKSFELGEAIRGLKRDLRGGGTGSMLMANKHHTAVDLEAGTKKAKDQRAALHHTALAFDHLESQGVPVKALLKKHGIKYVTGSPRSSRHHGHALPGEFAMNGSSITDEKAFEARKNQAKLRAASGKSLWGRSSDPELTQSESAQSTAIHELAHAIGMKRGSDGKTSPDRLQSVFHQLHRDGSLGNAIGMSPPAQAREWIKQNISEYACTNWHETDAELAATVLGRGYKPGTLPKALEDHVHQLFEKKS
jgi:hypothetical protein